MKFVESPFVEPTVPENRRSEGKKFLEVIESEFSSHELRLKRFKEFFGLYEVHKGDGYTSYVDTEISEKDLDDFTTYMTYVMKRVINASLQKESTQPKNLVADPIYSIFYHDVSHATGSVLRDTYKVNQNSIVPPVLTFKDGYSFNNKEVMEDELYGFLFYIVNKNNGAAENLTLELLKESQTCEQFIKNYINTVLDIVYQENNKEINRYLEKYSTDSDRERNHIWSMERYNGLRMIEDITTNPPKKIIELLQYVWNNRDNKHVLADLFFKEVGPFIEKLKKRNPKDIYKSKTL